MAVMGPLVVLSLALAGLAGLRGWLIWRGLAGRFPGRLIALCALQLSALCVVVAVVLASPVFALNALLPEIGLPWFGQIYLDYWPLFSASVAPALGLGIAAGLVAWRWRALRLYLISIVALVFLAVTIVRTEQLSTRAMCAAAAEQGVTQINRHSFYWSLRKSPREFSYDLHGGAEFDGQRYGWSYREMGWYLLPDSVMPGDAGLPFSCS